jgi:hypothetical protein
MTLIRRSFPLSVRFWTNRAATPLWVGENVSVWPILPLVLADLSSGNSGFVVLGKAREGCGHIKALSERAGNRLVALGLLDLDPDRVRREFRSRTALIARRYVPTDAGRAAVRR